MFSKSFYFKQSSIFTGKLFFLKYIVRDFGQIQQKIWNIFFANMLFWLHNKKLKSLRPAKHCLKKKLQFECHRWIRKKSM